MKKVVCTLLAILLVLAGGTHFTAFALEEQNYVTFYCSQCGEQIPAEGRYCMHCGAEIQTKLRTLFSFEDIRVVCEEPETCNMSYGEMLVPVTKLALTMVGENRNNYRFGVERVSSGGYDLPFSLSECYYNNTPSGRWLLSVDTDALLYFSSMEPSEIKVVFTIEDSAWNEVYRSEPVALDFSPAEWPGERRFADNTVLLNSDEITLTFLGVTPEGGHMTAYFYADNRSREEWRYNFRDFYINNCLISGTNGSGILQPRCTTVLGIRFGDYISGHEMPKIENLNTLMFSWQTEPAEYRSEDKASDRVEITYDENGSILRITGENVFVERPWKAYTYTNKSHKSQS